MLSTTGIRWRRSATALISLAGPLLLLAGAAAAASPACATSWMASQLAPPASAFRNIASVATSPTSMEVFWVAQNGSVQEECWLATTWSSTTIAPPGSADPLSDIAAAARVKNAVNWTIDLFWVAPNRPIEHKFTGNGLPWLTGPDVAPPGSAAPGASMTVLSRAPDTGELFWLGPDSQIKDAYWYQGGPSGSVTLAAAGPSTPAFDPRQITAVSRAPDTMEVWWIGKNGSVQDACYYDMAGWTSFQLAVPGSAYAGHPPGQITSASRAPDTMEVWWIGPAHSVQDAPIFLPPGTWTFFTLEPAGSAEFALAATSPAASSIDVFFRANGGTEVETAALAPPWYPPQPLEAPGPAATGGITAISRAPASDDAFWVTWSGAIEHAWK